MPFSCEIHFRGLTAFAFDKTPAEKGHAFLTRSERGERYHRPLLSYFPTQLDKDILPIAPDPLQPAPNGSTTAYRELENEVLTLEPRFASSKPSLSLNLGGPKMPADLNQAVADPANRFAFDFVPNLAAADPRMVLPQPTNGLAGVRSDCLQTSIADDAPITARLDFDQGELQANPEEIDGRWTFRTLGNPSSTSSIDQPLAESAILFLQDLESLHLRSSHGADLAFKIVPNPSNLGPVQITLSNEEPIDFLGVVGRGEDYAQLYKILDWPSGSSPNTFDRFVPHIVPGAPQTVREQLCGVVKIL